MTKGKVAFLLILLAISMMALQICPAENKDKGGEEINLNSLLVSEKTNIVTFYEEGNGTCKRFFPYLDALASNNKDVAVVKIDIKDLNSSICKQFNITAVPYFMIFNGKGKLKSQGDEARKDVALLIKPYLPQTVATNQNNNQNTANTSGGTSILLNGDEPGSEVDLTKYIVAGKTNIVDFYADW